jgi:putative transposase
VFSQVLQNVQERVDLALKAFFRRVKFLEKNRAITAFKVKDDTIPSRILNLFRGFEHQGLLDNHNLTKSTSDVAWKMLVNINSYKAESAGSKVILIDPRNTSKMCSRCGILVEKSLSDRIYNCPQCGADNG